MVKIDINLTYLSTTVSFLLPQTNQPKRIPRIKKKKLISSILQE